MTKVIMINIADLERLDAQHYWDFHYTDDRPLYLVIDAVSRRIEYISHHMDGTTYVGGGWDIRLEGEQEDRFIAQYADVYLDTRLRHKTEDEAV